MSTEQDDLVSFFRDLANRIEKSGIDLQKSRLSARNETIQIKDDGSGYVKYRSGPRQHLSLLLWFCDRDPPRPGEKSNFDKT